MRFRLLKYCCRIWDRGRVQFPDEHHLRPIVPLVLYLWATQDPDTARPFAEELRGAVSGPGGNLMTYRCSVAGHRSGYRH